MDGRQEAEPTITNLGCKGFHLGWVSFLSVKLVEWVWPIYSYFESDSSRPDLQSA
jgi:hypothetical protein